MTSSPSPSPALTPSLARLLAFAAGAAVANSYYNQAMLGHIAGDFALPGAEVAAIAALTQLGNAAGVLLLAPLGDRIERRRLILLTLGALVVALVMAAIAPSFGLLLLASLCVGTFATVAQQIVPLAVHLAAADRKGSVLGTVTGGILTGILLARTASGIISDLASWRVVFLLAAGLMLLTGVLLARRLPKVMPTTHIGYGALMASLIRLVAAHRALRRATLSQCLVFAAFMAFWSSIALELHSERFGLGSTAVGLLALVGASGAVAAPLAGRLADRGGAGRVAMLGMLLAALAFALLGVSEGSIIALVAATLMLDVAVQTSQIANQSVVYAIDPAARSRLNTIFMTAMLASGAIGSSAGALAWSHFGWRGVCAFGAAAALAGAALAARRR